MQYLFSFASEHPFVFLFCVYFLSSWRPIQVYKQYGKPPDEFYLHDGDAKDDRSR